jgi:hypothetical protein
MNWIQNRVAMISMLGIGGLMLFVAYQSGSDKESASFEVASQQSFDSLKQLDGSNLLDADLSSTAVPGVAETVMPLASYPQENLETEFQDEFSLPAEIDGSVPEVNPEFAGIVERYESLEESFEAAADKVVEVAQDIDESELYLTASDGTVFESNDVPVMESENVPPALTVQENVEALPKVSAPEKGVVTKYVGKRGWQRNPFIDAEPEIQSQPVTSEPFNVFESAESRIETSVFEKDEPVTMVSGQQTPPTQTPPMQAPQMQQQPQQPMHAQPVPVSMHPVRQQTMPTSATRPAVMVGISASAAQRAVHHVEYGKSLARRNASFAARQEFYSALGVLAQSNDEQSGTQTYTTSLRNAVVAMNEAEDFMVSDTESQLGMKVDDITAGHATKIIGETQARHMSPSQALQRYMAFAGQQLEIAGGQNVVSAETLYCLGKLHQVLSTKSLDPNSMDVAKSMVYQRAALGADETNVNSANELAVMLAQSGKTKEAKWLLKQGLLVRPTPVAWANLAKLHQRNGEHELAQLAMNERQIALNSPITPGPSKKISWVSSEAFIAASAPDVEEYSPVVQASAVEGAPTPEAIEVEPERKTIAEKIKDVIKR